MARRENHYEAAFEAYLRAQRLPYVAVDETRRALLGDGSLKSLDFIVSPAGAGDGWLIDVKGRQFPSGRRRQYFKNWSTRDELRSLAAWETLFGGRFQGLLVFAYEVVGELAPLPAEHLFAHRQRLYGFVAMRLDHYSSWSRTLSPKWDTVLVPAGAFRNLARPVGDFVLPQRQAAAI